MAEAATNRFSTPSFVQVRGEEPGHRKQHTRGPSQQPVSENSLSESDFQYFENIVRRFAEELQVPIVQRRANARKSDPVEEIQEIYKDMKEQEKSFKKISEICIFMIEKNREFCQDFEKVNLNQDQSINRLQYLEDLNINLSEENKRLVQRELLTNEHIRELEQINIAVRNELQEKMETLAEYERSMNEGSFTQRDSSFTQGLHIQKELTEAKKTLLQQGKKLKENEEFLNLQSQRYDMEIKKCNALLNENKLLKEQHLEMSFQIDELNHLVLEKDSELDQFEERIRFLEQELSRKELHVKSKSKTQQIIGGNAFIQASINIAKSRSKTNSNNGNVDQSSTGPPLEKQKSISYVHSGDDHPATPKEEKHHYIRVPSQLEDFRPTGEKRRKGSCPMLVVDKSGNGFRIYDKKYPNTKAVDDKKVAPPPLFYPFNELERVVEDAKIQARIPQSLRYETEYLTLVGKQYQSILNNQQKRPEIVYDEEESDYDDRAFGQIIREPLQELGQHDTFRPVSILDTGMGLGINEDEFNYEFGGSRATNNLMGEDHWQDYNRQTQGYNQSFAEGGRDQTIVSDMPPSESIYSRAPAQEIASKGKGFQKKILQIEVAEEQSSNQKQDKVIIASSAAKGNESHDTEAKQPIETPSFQSRSKQENGGSIEKGAFFQNSTPSTKLRNKKGDEEIKVSPGHSKKHTDESTNIGVSTNVNPPSPNEAFSIRTISADTKLGGSSSYQPNSTAQIISQEQLNHHQRVYSSNAPFGQQSSAQSAQKSNSAEDGRGSHSASSLKSPTIQNSRKDPNEEFFMMTLLAYKLNHKEQQKILQIDGLEMYAQAQKQSVAFYNWPKWIEEQLDRVYLDYIYRKKQAVSVSVKPEFVEQKSRRFVPEIEFRSNYF